MRFISYLQEEYETTLMAGNAHFSVFKNPDASDFKDLEKEIRQGGDRDLNVRAFVDMEHKTLYIWDANKALHYTVMRDLVRTTNISNRSIHVQSVLKNHKISIDNVDSHKPIDVPWVKVYFT